MKRPHAVVCAGGGGVGKTTTSAALALAFARAGRRTLVVTIDPARRLADALGVSLGPHPVPISLERLGTSSLDAEAAGKLFALMPEPKESTKMFMELLFASDPSALLRLANNGLYKALCDSLAGMHEVVCMALLDRASRASLYDVVVIDTAPSRYALDFVSYPARLASLLEGPAIAFLANLAAPSKKPSGGPFSWARRSVEAALGRILGPRVLRDATGIFQEMAGVREQFASLASGCASLLISESSRYVLVSAPSGAALADTQFLARRMQKLKIAPSLLVLNRADTVAPGYAVSLAHDPCAPIAAAVAQLEAERVSRTSAADKAEKTLAHDFGDLSRVRLPFLMSSDPTVIVKRLSDALAVTAEKLVPRT